ncbi:DUF6265 family protein [Flavobacterium sp. NRK1]|uniref:DUF6265 family protein n=1 Tax=Flavobacterium sp. NRK1 TaxID=2954929 RepID=UPI0020923F35|nr:DUF6265 family protein [Flavobacterium sp. NRK1]MCO6146642.1 DUF6265 family protein [Flavobacterium sp. NRK1]
MKHTVTALCTAAICCLIVSCKKETKVQEQSTEKEAKNYSLLEKADWFIGNWQNTTAEPNFGEVWKKANDSVFKGKSFIIKDKQVNFNEFMTLIESKGKLTFIAAVPGQNEEQEVSFEGTSLTSDSIVFENPDHDFPNKIVYNKIGEDSLVAVIYGMQKGKPASVKFAMKRSDKINEHHRKNKNSILNK